MKLKVIVAAFFASSLTWAGNGSSGVGTAGIPVVDSIYGSSLGGRLKRDGKQIVESATGRVVFELVEILPNELAALENSGRLVRATLGVVSGQYEHTPEIVKRDSLGRTRGLHEMNYWILCGKTCYRLRPMSENDPLVARFIGTLEILK